MKKITSYILLSLVLLSCERALDVPFPEHEPKLVVNAFLDAGKPIDVYLSRSYGALENFKGDDLNVSDATLELFLDGTRLGQMEAKDTLIQDTLFNGTVESRTLVKYQAPGLLAAHGGKYEIKASHSKYPAVLAQTVVPGQSVISNIELKQNVYRFSSSEGFSESQSLLRVNIQDPSGEKNFYRIRLDIEIEVPGFPDEKYRASIFVAGPERGRDANGAYKTNGPWLSDEGRDGQSWLQDFVVTLPNAYDPGDEIMDLPISKAYLTVYSANEDSYQYLEKLAQQSESNDGFALFPPEAIVVFSNVEGGHGIFGGLNVMEIEF